MQGYPLARVAIFLTVVLYVPAAAIVPVLAATRLGATGELISGKVMTVVVFVTAVPVLLVLAASLNDQP